MNIQNEKQGKSTDLKEKAMALQATIQIGKSGLSESVVDEIKKQLKKRKLIKIKFLKSVLEGKSKKELADEVVEITGAKVVMKTGFTLVLYKG